MSSALNYEFTKLIEPSLQDNMQRAYDCLIGERVRLIHLLKFKHPCITIDTLVFALVAADNSLSACFSWPLYVFPRRMLRGKTNVINIFTYYPLYKQGVYYRRSKYENSLKKKSRNVS